MALLNVSMLGDWAIVSASSWASTQAGSALSAAGGVRRLAAEAKVAAERGLVVNQGNSGPGIGRCEGRCDSRGATADHGDVDVQVAAAEFRLEGCIDINAAQPAGAPDDPPRQRPQRLGPVQGLVVEADGHQPVQPVQQRQEVEPQRRPGVLASHFQPRLHGTGAGAHVGFAAGAHQAVGAGCSTAEDAPRPVILEAAAEDAGSCGIKRRGHGVAPEALYPASVKLETLPGQTGQWPRLVGVRAVVVGCYFCRAYRFKLVLSQASME